MQNLNCLRIWSSSSHLSQNLRRLQIKLLEMIAPHFLPSPGPAHFSCAAEPDPSLKKTNSELAMNFVHVLMKDGHELWDRGIEQLIYVPRGIFK